MFDLLVLALLQVATLTGTPTSNIGGSGWDHDFAGTTPTESAIGGSGWDHDYTGSTGSADPATSIGGSGWDHD